MQRQDEFLRSLTTIAEVNEKGDTPFYGLSCIRHMIKSRLPLLKPVAYENYDLSSGFSGCGINHICGDNASIVHVRNLTDRVAALEPYPKLLREAEAKLADAYRRLAAYKPHWLVHTKGKPGAQSWEIVVLREDNDHGARSYGWYDDDKKIHIGSSPNKISQEVWDALLNAAAVIAERKNNEER